MFRRLDDPYVRQAYLCRNGEGGKDSTYNTYIYIYIRSFFLDGWMDGGGMRDGGWGG